MRPVSVVAGVDQNSHWLKSLRRAKSEFLVLRETFDPTELAGAAMALRPEVVLVSVGFSETEPWLLSRIKGLGARCLLVGSPDAIADQMRAEHLRIPLCDGSPQGISAALDQPDPLQQNSGQLLAVCGPAGSPGVSTVAGNIAAETASESVLIDADPRSPSQAFLLGAREEPSGLLAALAQGQVGTIDRESWQMCLAPVAGEILLATGTSDHEALVSLSGTLPVLTEVSRECAELTVLDCGSGGLSDWSASAVARADGVAVVAAPTALGMHRLTRWWARHRPVLAGAVTLIWNGVGGLGAAALGSDPVTRLREASKFTGAGVGFAVLPEDGIAAAAMNRVSGPLRVVAPECELREAIESLPPLVPPAPVGAVAVPR